MATYSWVCEECKLYWDRDYSVVKGNVPTRTRCPECNKLSHRKWGDPPPVHFRGEGWTSTPGSRKIGSSDDAARELMKSTQNRINHGWQAYHKYEPYEGYIKEMGGRRLNEEELTKKLTAAKKLSAQIYDKHGIDPTKRYKPQ